MDSLLLGSWVNPASANSILDIGTGCGILAMIMAYKSNALIDAIELDQESAEEARQNFYSSLFHRRLGLIQQDFQVWSSEQTKKYDIIITNPPYFVNDLPPLSQKKSQARHTASLAYEDLASGAAKLLNENGKLHLVLPYTQCKLFMESARLQQLHLQKQLLIFPFRGHPPNRVNLTFGFDQTSHITTEHLPVREEDGRFSSAYKKLLNEMLLGINFE